MTEQAATFQLFLPEFDGAIAAFIGEIEDGTRAVDEVPVSEISAQFLRWARAETDLDLLVAGDLLRAGARLAAMKSAALLQVSPGEEEEEQVAEVPDRQRPDPDRTAIAASGWLALRQGVESFPLEPVPELMARQLEPRSPLALVASLREMGRREERNVSRLAIPAFARLETAVSSLMRALRSGVALSFRRIVADRSRQDAVVQFLAVLELLRRRQAVARQTELFGDISIEWMQADVEVRHEPRAG